MGDGSHCALVLRQIWSYSTHVGWERDRGPKELEVALECLGLKNQKTLDHNVICVEGWICGSRLQAPIQETMDRQGRGLSLVSTDRRAESRASL